MSKQALIVGAGLGGLLCGRMLQRKGWDVRILEADDVPGGVLHGFEWEGSVCERGFHSVGGLAPGETLEKLFRPLGLMDLPWYQVPADEGFPFLRLNSGSELEREHILEPYRKSVWRLKGGGQTLVDALVENLDVHCGKRVQSIENKVITCEDASMYTADVIVCDLHPLTTMQMVRDHVRPSYLHRLQSLENGRDIFTVYCLLEPGCVPWQGNAVFLEDRLMLHFGEPESGILELLQFGPGHPDEMIRRAETRLPGLTIRKYCTQSYPGYGVKKYSQADFIAPVTPLPWLFLTGQNLGLHGIQGTVISALNTCKSIES